MEKSVTDDSRWPGDLAFTAAVAALFGFLVLRIAPDLLHGELIDPDSYMRLVRVRRLAGPGGWFDGTIPRSNTPFGETLHWTRPLDVLILMVSWLGEPFLGFQRALHIAGVIIAPVLLIAICFTTAWAVRPLAGERVRYYTMLAVLAQVGIMGYALPGRPDHNMLILLAFVAMLGSAVRMFLDRDATWSPWVTGAWAGLGMWISTEFLMALFVLLGTLVFVWVWKGELAIRARAASIGLLAVVVIAILLEHPPGSLLVVEYDRISVVHLLITVIVAVFWFGAASDPARKLDLQGRTIYALIGALFASGLVLAIVPQFFGGPMVNVHPELKRNWLPFITEFQPYLVPREFSGLGRILAYLGHAMVATAVVLHGLWKDRCTRRLYVWTLLGLGLLVFIPLGIRWVRFVTYAEILGVIGTMFFLARCLEVMENRLAGIRLSGTRVLSTVVLLVGPLLLGAAIMEQTESTRGALRSDATQVDACPVDELVSILNDPTGLGDRQRTVLAHVDLGPVLLYRTEQSVVATPYHRNARGILDWQHVMSTRDPREARRVIRARGIDLVVTCRPPIQLREGVMEQSPSFETLLRAGENPEWLEPHPASDADEGLRIYEVDSADPRMGQLPGAPDRTAGIV